MSGTQGVGSARLTRLLGNSQLSSQVFRARRSSQCVFRSGTQIRRGRGQGSGALPADSERAALPGPPGPLFSPKLCPVRPLGRQSGCQSPLRRMLPATAPVPEQPLPDMWRARTGRGLAVSESGDRSRGSGTLPVLPGAANLPSLDPGVGSVRRNPERADPSLQVLQPPPPGPSSGHAARESLRGAARPLLPFLPGAGPFPSAAPEKTGIRPDAPPDADPGPKTGPSRVPGPSQVASDPAPVRSRLEGPKEERAQRLPAPAGAPAEGTGSRPGGRHPHHGRHLPRDLQGPQAGRPGGPDPDPDRSPCRPMERRLFGRRGAACFTRSGVFQAPTGIGVLPGAGSGGVAATSLSPGERRHPCRRPGGVGGAAVPSLHFDSTLRPHLLHWRLATDR